MNQQLRQPEPLSFEGNIDQNWKKWMKKFEIYLTAIQSDTKQDTVKIAIFLHVIGDEAVEKYDTLGLSEEDGKNYKKVIAAYEKYCVPKKNESINRHLFFHRNQNVDETFDNFLTDLKKLSNDCSFGELQDSLIRDRIIGGIINRQLKDRLLREEDLTLEKCIRLCKTAELAEKQLKTLQQETSHSVDIVKPKTTGTDRQRKVKPVKPSTSRGYQQQWSQQHTYKCGKCGYQHLKKQCPAYNKVCAYCKKKKPFCPGM